jgi:hypothetical protein
LPSNRRLISFPLEPPFHLLQPPRTSPSSSTMPPSPLLTSALSGASPGPGNPKTCSFHRPRPHDGLARRCRPPELLLAIFPFDGHVQTTDASSFFTKPPITEARQAPAVPSPSAATKATPLPHQRDAPPGTSPSPPKPRRSSPNLPSPRQGEPNRPQSKCRHQSHTSTPPT